MKNIKFIYKRLVKYFNSFINKILLKYLTKKKKTFLNKEKIKISNYNKAFITIICLLFIYLFYLIIPVSYDKVWVQKNLEKILLEEFGVNFSVSSEITYEILPSPHYNVKNANILDNNPKEIQKLSEIKILKVFVSQKNFFKKEELKINKVLIKNANFYINTNDFEFFKNLVDKKFSTKKINIKKSRFFLKNTNNEIITILSAPRLSMFYDDQELSNLLNLKGEIFNMPFKLKLNKDFTKLNHYKWIIKSNKTKLNILNESNKNSNNITLGSNTTSILNSTFVTNYKYDKNLTSFKSSKSKLANFSFDYDGELSTNPFDLVLNINLDKFKIYNLINPNSIFIEILKNKILFNENISAKISINQKNQKSNSFFNLSKIILNINNGQINFDQTNLVNKKIGSLKVNRSNLFFEKNALLLNSNVTFEVKNLKKLYFFFQTPKKHRIEFSNMRINFDYNLLTEKVTINNIKFDEINPSKRLDDVISAFNIQEMNNIKNLIRNKNLFNRIISAYSG
ncbi:hypothetical protein VP91_00007490 [Candidatus Pelagibacter ubique]|uniref:AsmA domain-containing protein n=1 Tax=Pelagibacter ubique TaxID=198252 RepID=A0ABX1T0G6_PELUQ|nr:hypothetical protein [Candidatus Pelagibacter ubique]NMN67602.1 hypothetical protein [Candidatus Pelagibacter ubique]